MGERQVKDNEMIDVILDGQIIEENPNASPFPKCLLMKFVRNNEPLYVSVAFDGEHAYIITVHWYDPEKWIAHGPEGIEVSMKCPECGGRFEKKLITHHQPWAEDIYRFENVPALVCVQCGEVFLEAEISQKIDEFITSKQAPIRYDKLPVFTLEAEAL